MAQERKNFLNLPTLALELLTDFMTISEIVQLSMFSKKAASRIRSIGLHRCHVFVDIQIEKCETNILIDNGKARDDQFYLNFKETLEGGNLNLSNWKVNGMDVPVRPDVEDPLNYHHGDLIPQFEVYCPQNMEGTMIAFVSHVFNIFPNCHLRRFGIKFSNTEDEFDVIKILPSVPTVQGLRLDGEASKQVFQSVLKNVTVTKWLYNQCNYTGNLEIVHKLQCTDRITSGYSMWMKRSFFMNLNIPKIELRRTTFGSSGLMEFLKKWKNSTGDEMRNIHYLKMEILENLKSHDFNDLGTQRWDPSRRAKYWLDESDTVDCAEGKDFERADGLLGTIVLPYPNLAIFVVWHDRFPEEP